MKDLLVLFLPAEEFQAYLIQVFISSFSSTLVEIGSRAGARVCSGAEAG